MVISVHRVEFCFQLFYFSIFISTLYFQHDFLLYMRYGDDRSAEIGIVLALCRSKFVFVDWCMMGYHFASFLSWFELRLIIVLFSTFIFQVNITVQIIVTSAQRSSQYYSDNRGLVLISVLITTNRLSSCGVEFSNFTWHINIKIWISWLRRFSGLLLLPARQSTYVEDPSQSSTDHFCHFSRRQTSSLISEQMVRNIAKRLKTHF